MKIKRCSNVVFWDLVCLLFFFIWIVIVGFGFLLDLLILMNWVFVGLFCGILLVGNFVLFWEYCCVLDDFEMLFSVVSLMSGEKSYG